MLIAGLGNPGKKYEKTRHNVGFEVLDILAEREVWKISRRAQALFCKKEIAGKNIELLKPQTFMNRSGLSVVYAMRKHSLESSDLIVIHDDLDLPCGVIRISKNSQSAGHKGVESIISALKTKDFTRVRLGIKPGHPVANAEKFVLSSFAKEECGIIEKTQKRTAEAVECIIEKGVEKAMEKYN